MKKAKIILPVLIGLAIPTAICSYLIIKNQTQAKKTEKVNEEKSDSKVNARDVTLVEKNNLNDATLTKENNQKTKEPQTNTNPAKNIQEDNSIAKQENKNNIEPNNNNANTNNNQKNQATLNTTTVEEDRQKSKYEISRKIDIEELDKLLKNSLQLSSDATWKKIMKDEYARLINFAGKDSFDDERDNFFNVTYNWNNIVKTIDEMKKFYFTDESKLEQLKQEWANKYALGDYISYELQKEFQKEVLISELVQLEEYFTTSDKIWLQIENRLKWMIAAVKNNYDKNNQISWGIDDSDNFSTTPKKYVSETASPWVNLEYVAKWIRFYKSIKWIKFEPSEGIDEIHDEDVIAFQDYKKYPEGSKERNDVLKALHFERYKHELKIYKDISESLYSKYSDASAYSSYNIYLNDLFTQPNFFIDNALNFRQLKTGKDNYQEITKFIENWKRVLPKIIKKGWSDEQIIKALSIYITSNSLYLTNPLYRNDKYKTIKNYNDNHFESPIALFENERSLMCNGYATNLSMSLTLLNKPVRLISVDTKQTAPQFPQGFGHAYNEVWLDGRWKVVDLTVNDKWEKDYFQTYEVNLNNLIRERNDKFITENFLIWYDDFQATLSKYKNPREYEYDKINEIYDEWKETQKAS
ncbi:hypothetical protein [Mycoplasma buteonis]|uniref:hypothetical protein n=1 Tax=Mycoplasma buteonis TaxID=171280 RepID=UPI000559C846|nr:hypothetical protein [Mycoplasma buteonis]